MELGKPSRQAKRIPRNWLSLLGGGSWELKGKPEQGRQWKRMKEEKPSKMSIGQSPLDLALQLALTLASRLPEAAGVAAGLQGPEEQVGGCQWSEVTGSKG